jgi:hypothetical protein
MKKIFICSLFVLVLLCPVFAVPMKSAPKDGLSLPDLSQSFTVSRKEWLKARLDTVSYDIRTATKGTADVTYDVIQSKGIFALIFLYKSYAGSDNDLEILKKRVSEDAHYVIDDYEWSKNLPVIIELEDLRIIQQYQ